MLYRLTSRTGRFELALRYIGDHSIVEESAELVVIEVAEPVRDRLPGGVVAELVPAELED